jgi:hypothetical protein
MNKGGRYCLDESPSSSSSREEVGPIDALGLTDRALNRIFFLPVHLAVVSSIKAIRTRSDRFVAAASLGLAVGISSAP